MKRLISVSVILWVILTICTCAFALEKDEHRDVLQGLEEVYVIVERLKPEIERDGLFGSTLQTDVELMLRMAGMNIMSEQEWLRSLCGPYIYLHVDAFKYSEGYVYKIQLSLREAVRLLRKRMRAVATTVRLPDQLGVTPHLADIRDEAKELVEDFIKAWLAANPKQGK